MEEKDPMEKFLDELSRLLEQTKEVDALKQEQGLPPGLLAKLEQLEKQGAFFEQLNQAALANLGISPEEVKSIVASYDHLPEKEKRLLGRTQALKTEVEKKQRKLMMESAAEKHREQTTGKTGQQARKKKFQRLGGRKSWKPL